MIKDFTESLQTTRDYSGQIEIMAINKGQSVSVTHAFINTQFQKGFMHLQNCKKGIIAVQSYSMSLFLYERWTQHVIIIANNPKKDLKAKVHSHAFKCASMFSLGNLLQQRS